MLIFAVSGGIQSAHKIKCNSILQWVTAQTTRIKDWPTDASQPYKETAQNRVEKLLDSSLAARLATLPS